MCTDPDCLVEDVLVCVGVCVCATQNGQRVSIRSFSSLIYYGRLGATLFSVLFDFI